eukprot:c3601_g1_i1.p1 GENE.c3601_g1_i1~~c3601_g1_i1.p1  ORF type:complete len:458 (-),score=109.97 c3601_g1_i1:488-1813(-)
MWFRVCVLVVLALVSSNAAPTDYQSEPVSASRLGALLSSQPGLLEDANRIMTMLSDPEQLGIWPFPPADPDTHRTMIEEVESKGYPIEQHFATTRDGYILQIFRIPHGRNGPNSGPAPVVLIQHCLLCSTFDFINNFPNQSLSFVLADAGYDVWLPNNRGNLYSMNHTTLDVNSDEFWDFTWDEMALFDLPAEFDYILGHTGASTLSYIGHSEGTTQAFAGFSMIPSLAERVNVFIALAPIAFVGHSRSPIFNLLARLDVAELFNWFGIKQFLPANSFLSFFAPVLCKDIPHACDASIFLFCGPTHHVNSTRMQVYVAHTPAGTSVKNMIHWTQQIKYDTFSMYDYGSPDKNMKVYNSTTPPAYDLSSVNVPVVLFTGGNDILADEEDLTHLRGLLGKSLKQEIHQDTWAHLDYAWAFDGADVFMQVADVIRNANSNSTSL